MGADQAYLITDPTGLSWFPFPYTAPATSYPAPSGIWAPFDNGAGGKQAVTVTRDETAPVLQST